MTSSSDREWVFFKTSAGVPKVAKEIDDLLTPSEAIRLQVVLDRVRAGNELPRDVKQLTRKRSRKGERLEPLREVVFDGDDRSFRLIFSKLRGQAVLLALVCFEKRQQQTPKAKLDLADRRLKEWKSRNP